MASLSQSGASVAMLQDEARALAVSLAKALNASSLSEEEKVAWAALIPEMRLDQLSRFAVILDASVEKAAKAEVAELSAKYRTVLEKYAAIQSQTDSDFMKGVGGMVEDLRKAERSLM